MEETNVQLCGRRQTFVTGQDIYTKSCTREQLQPWMYTYKTRVLVDTANVSAYNWALTLPMRRVRGIIRQPDGTITDCETNLADLEKTKTIEEK